MTLDDRLWALSLVQSEDLGGEGDVDDAPGGGEDLNGNGKNDAIVEADKGYLLFMKEDGVLGP